MLTAVCLALLLLTLLSPVYNFVYWLRQCPPRLTSRFHALVDNVADMKTSASVSAPRDLVKIASDRIIQPGDFVELEEYGIGRYERLIRVPMSSREGLRTKQEEMLVIRYLEGDIVFSKQYADKVYFHSKGDVIKPPLDSLLDQTAWDRRVRLAKKQSNKSALHLLKLMVVRQSIHRPPCPPDGEVFRQFESEFTYTPTVDQIRCFQDIAEDMINKTRPMDRLVCGDVGFGKTEVAMRAIYRAVLANRQVALVAPTRVLAKQHFNTLTARMPHVRIRLLQGQGQGRARQESSLAKREIADGSCQVAIGTHALLARGLSFARLGLVVIDEEHRFGVEQKEFLKAKSAGIDVLALSATPIPRTLSLSLQGIRDFSRMSSPPAGRKASEVYVGHMANKNDEKVVRQAIIHEISRQGQVFVVVPQINMMDETEELLLKLVPGLDIVRAHGQQSNLEENIDDFITNKRQVLLSTQVIENGIDIPNANTMIVLCAERFGVASLYQLRGRVGRSNVQAYSFFLSNSTNREDFTESYERLKVLKHFSALGSGYELAEYDMAKRGVGDLVGLEQSGDRVLSVDLRDKFFADAVNSAKTSLLLPALDAYVSLGESEEEGPEKSVIVQMFYTILGESQIFDRVKLVQQYEDSVIRKSIHAIFTSSYDMFLSPEQAFVSKKKRSKGTTSTKETLPKAVIIDELIALIEQHVAQNQQAALDSLWLYLLSSDEDRPPARNNQANNVENNLSSVNNEEETPAGKALRSFLQWIQKESPFNENAQRSMTSLVELMRREKIRASCRKIGVQEIVYVKEKQQIFLCFQQLQVKKGKGLFGSLLRKIRHVDISFVSLPQPGQFASFAPAEDDAVATLLLQPKSQASPLDSLLDVLAELETLADDLLTDHLMLDTAAPNRQTREKLNPDMQKSFETRRRPKRPKKPTMQEYD